VISDADRIQLENEALRKCVQSFANISSDHPEVDALVQRARRALQQVAERRRALRPVEPELIEQACFAIENFCLSEAKHVPPFQPFVVLERWGKRHWQAFVDGHEEIVGLSDASSALDAVEQLFGRLRSYDVRLGRELGGWHPDRSWNTCERKNCRGALERLGAPGDNATDGEPLQCIDCGAGYMTVVRRDGSRYARRVKTQMTRSA